MKEVKHYMCEICGTEYAEKNMAEDCEKCHKRPELISHIRYLSKSQNGSGYPVAITVRMNDGTCQIYKR